MAVSRALYLQLKHKTGSLGPKLQIYSKRGNFTSLLELSTPNQFGSAFLNLEQFDILVILFYNKSFSSLAASWPLQ